jgi:3-oxoacyl-[acyl-carrier protein] reductase
MSGFEGKVAFVTGAASGFGYAFSEALLARGASVAVVDIDKAACEAAAKRLGGAAIPVICDVADETSVAAAVQETVQAFGGIDLLINNAGLHSARYNKSFQELGTAETRRLFDVNIMGVVNCTLAARESMAQRGGGTILNIASIASYNVGNGYGVSKLAVRGLTIAFAKELSPDRIRVNAISPGLIATDVIRAEMPQALFDQFLEMQPIKRTGEVQDIVSAMLYLCSDEASFITGETLKVAGGYPLQI